LLLNNYDTTCGNFKLGTTVRDSAPSAFLRDLYASWIDGTTLIEPGLATSWDVSKIGLNILFI